MTRRPPTGPTVDPTPIFEIFRGGNATALLTAAVAHFGLFERLAARPMAFDELCAQFNLSPRAAHVLLVALRAMGLLTVDAVGRFELTELSQEHLLPGGEYDVSDYIGQAANSPLVLEMVERLRTSRPAGAKPEEEGIAFIYRDGMDSAMEREAAARRHTLALAGRAKNVAPILAQRVPINDAHMLLDVGGGTGIYSIACLQEHPNLQAIIWDRPQVLKVAREMANAYGVAERMRFIDGDMFADPVPAGCDVMLLSNILHDWDVPECRALVSRCAAALPLGGQLMIHDVFLNDALDGPLSIALYSATLFAVTEGRAYSRAEYATWLTEAGLTSGEIIPTLIHCGVLPGRKLV